jgi:hypothetical protein
MIVGLCQVLEFRDFDSPPPRGGMKLSL